MRLDASLQTNLRAAPMMWRTRSSSSGAVQKSFGGASIALVVVYLYRGAIVNILEMSY